VSRADLLLRLAQRAPLAFRGLFALSSRGILPRVLYRHWFAERVRERVPRTAPAWLGHVVRLGNGMPIEVDVRDQIGHQIAVHGWWEPDTVDFVRGFLRPGMTFVDVGANIGQFALVASQCVGPGGQVHAFEPHPTVYRVLRRNLRRAGCANATASRMALSDTAGRATLFLHPIAHVGGTSLRPTRWAALLPSASIVTATLDAYARDARLARLDLVKIDVEGAELFVLEGGRATLDAHPDVVLVVEFLRRAAEGFGYAVEDLEAWLRARGFELYAITVEGLVPYAPIADRNTYVNVVATRRRLDHLAGPAGGAFVQGRDGSVRVDVRAR
jgi:FkbM family methyltransferase